MQVTATILVRGQVFLSRAVPQSYSSPHQAAVGLRSLRVVIMHDVRYRLSTENKFKFLLEELSILSFIRARLDQQGGTTVAHRGPNHDATGDRASTPLILAIGRLRVHSGLLAGSLHG
jgi:hypothetical protein